MLCLNIKTHLKKSVKSSEQYTVGEKQSVDLNEVFLLISFIDLREEEEKK